MRELLFGFWSIAAKELLHLRRDKASLVIALIVPIMQTVLFGYAINLDVRNISTVVMDSDHSRESRRYIMALQNTHYLRVTGFVETPEAAESALRSGAARVAVLIPPDFARRSGAGKKPAVRVLVDGSDNLVASSARLPFLASYDAGNAASVVQKFDADTVPSVDARIDMMFNPWMRSAIYMIPGLIAIILQLVTVTLTSFSIVREREQGTLEQLMVSPVGRLGLMLGKLAPYAVLAFVEMIAIVFIGQILFNVPLAGSFALLLLLSVPFIVASLGIGLLISTVAQNQAQALQMMMLTLLPSILMSGYVFPRSTMPEVLYLASNVLPVTHFVEITRGIMVRGAGFTDLWHSVLALLILSTILITVSTSRFQKSVG